jgi:hypothetical protein
MKSRLFKSSGMLLGLCVAGGLGLSCSDDPESGTSGQNSSSAGAGGTGGSAAGAGGSGGSAAGAGGTGGSAAGSGGGAGGGAPTVPTCAQSSSSDLAFPADEMPFGVSLSEWGERWFQWALGLPKTDHPSYGGPCDQAQDGPAWFLGTPRPGSSTRDCTVPSNAGILVTAAGLIMNETADLPEDDCAAGQCPYPEDGYREMCLDPNSGFPSLIESVCIEVDGVAIPMDDYSLTTGVFRAAPDPIDPLYPLPMAGPYGANTCPGDCAEGTDRHFYRCGYWLMLRPLPAGEHTVRIFSVTPEAPANPGVQDYSEVTYHLTVE